MNINSEVIRKKRDELEWWNTFSPIMAHQWELTPKLNNILRRDLITDFVKFLFKENGHILDVGCGNGWITRIFSDRGMICTAIDFSENQISLAKSLSVNSNHEGINYLCTDIIDYSSAVTNEKYDSIIVNALLHHLSEEEISRVVKNLEGLLREKGRIYFYEPFVFDDSTDRKFARKLILLIPKILTVIYKVNNRLFITNDFYRKYKKLGYQGKSPHERSFPSNIVTEAFEGRIQIDSIVPFHVFSLTYGTYLMSLKKIPMKILSLFTKWIYELERYLLNSFNWKSITSEKWVLSGLKIQKI